MPGQGLEKMSFDFNIETSDMGTTTLLDGLDKPVNPEDVTTITDGEPDDKDKKKPVADPKKSDKDKKELPKDVKNTPESEPEEDVDLLGEEDEEDNQDTSDTTKKNPKESDKKEEGEEDNIVTDEIPQFQALTRDLIKLGAFRELEEGEKEPTTPEEFLAKFRSDAQAEASDTITAYLSRFGEDYQEMFDVIFNKGVHPRDYLAAYVAVEDYTNLDLTISSNQEKIIKEGLKETGFDLDDIASEFERIKNYGDEEAAAKRYQKILVKKQADKLAQQEQQRTKELETKRQQRDQFNTGIKTVLSEKLKTKEFDGIPVTGEVANQAYDFLFTEKYEAKGERLTEFDKYMLDLRRPENYALKVKIALLALNNFDLSKVKQKAVSNESSELFSTLASRKTKTVSNKQSLESGPVKSWFDNR